MSEAEPKPESIVADAEPLHIIELEAENFKRLRSVRIRPDGSPLFVIGGRNEQGKSSAIDSIWAVIGGGKASPLEPVRQGARSARARLDLGAFTAERTWSPKGTKLVLTGPDGEEISSPQTVLNSLFAENTFDPLEFLRREDKQAETLRKLLGLDFTEIDAEYDQTYKQRTKVNCEVESIAARFEAIADPGPGVPDKEIVLAELLDELRKDNETKRQNDAKRTDATKARGNANTKKTECEGIAFQIEQLKTKLKETQDRFDELDAIASKAEADAAELKDPDVKAVETKIATAEQTNKKVREAIERKRLLAEETAQRKKSGELSDKLAELKEKKAAKIAAAKFPVPGLGFDESGVTLDGLPFKQASQSKRLRVCVAIAAALSPRLRVIGIRDGNCLDDDGMQLLYDLAQEYKLQVWIEKVSKTGEGCSIVIEDGMVVGDEEAQPEPAVAE